jgi:hypothetical protein
LLAKRERERRRGRAIRILRRSGRLAVVRGGEHGGARRAESGDEDD